VPRYQVSETPATYEKPVRPQMLRPEDVFALCRPMVRYRQEVFRALLLDARHRLIRKVTVSKGTLDASLVHPRDVFREAIRTNAGAIVLVHNHPSGDPEPSSDDRELTDRLIRAGEILGIKILDHVIVAKGGYVSFCERGLSTFTTQGDRF
jgi:DNA repair protein RadC